MDGNVKDAVWLYHKQFAPEGQIFQADAMKLEVMANEGWVDNPAKIGVNMWGSGEGVDAEVKKFQREFEREGSEIPPIGGRGPRTHSDEVERLAKEKQQLYDSLRTRESEIEMLKRQLRESKEKYADHDSDARKLEDKPRTGPQITGADLKKTDESTEETAQAEDGSGVKSSSGVGEATDTSPDPSPEIGGEAGSFDDTEL